MKSRERREGITLVHTGEGKGKSSSAFGVVFRAAGWGLKVCVIQYIKGKWKTGEQQAGEKFDNIEWHALGDGFTWDTQDRRADIEAAQKTWTHAAGMLGDASFDLVVLDELTYMLAFKYLPAETVLEAIKNRPEGQSVIVTGRGGGSELRGIMDTVSEVKEVEHAYRAGIQARKGVDY